MCNYSLIDGNICFDGRPLWTKDGTALPVDSPEHFQAVAIANSSGLQLQTKLRWFTDGKAIYVQAQQGSAMAYTYFYRIDDADLASFEVLNERYARDSRRAYYVTGKAIHPKKPDSFKPVKKQWPVLNSAGQVAQIQVIEDEYFATDGCDLYVCGTRMQGVDAPSVRFIAHDYWMDRHHVYVGRKKIDADIASFVAIEQHFTENDFSLWVTDRHSPFAGFGNRIVTADVEQQHEKWRPFFTAHPELRDYWWHRTEENCTQPVNYRGIALHGIEPASFAFTSVPSLLGGLSMDLCGDEKGIHCFHFYSPESAGLTRVSDLPIKQARVISPGYWTDGHTIFLQLTHYETSHPIKKADAPSFTALLHGWAKDHSRIYYQGVEKAGLNRTSFRIEGVYAWDEKTLFCEGKPMRIKTPHSEIRIPHPSFLQTSKELYCGRRPVSAKRVHLPTLEFMGADFARDHQQVFLVTPLGLHPVNDANPTSFHVHTQGVGTDGEREFFAAKLRQIYSASLQYD